MSESQESKWEGLLDSFSEGLERAIGELKNKDVENIPGAKDALLNRLDLLKIKFTRNEGELFEKVIDNTIQNNFFPNISNFAEAFSKILKSRTHQQDFIINELLNGFVTSRTKAIASYIQGTIIDRMVEAFANRSDFHIVDHQFYTMFGDPNKPRSYVKKNLKELIKLFGLVSKEFVIDKDKRKSERKVYTFYTFPADILAILKEKYIIIERKEEPIVKALKDFFQNSKKSEATEIKIKIDMKSLRFIDNRRSLNSEDIKKIFTESERDDLLTGDTEDKKIYENHLYSLIESIKNIIFGKIIFKTQNWTRYIDNRKNLDLIRENSRFVKGVEITIIFYEEIENRIKDIYEKRFIEVIQPTNDMEIYINGNEYEESKEELNLSLSISKREKDNNLVYAHVSEDFDRNVFICLFLANLAINRKDIEKIGGTYTINGISAIFALILLLSLMPKISVSDNHPILNDPSFDKDFMSIIPKSWMMRQVLEALFEPMIKIVAYRLGGGLWLNQIKDTEINKKIHNQIRFLLKDVNKWILGNLCRVEIPIFVEIANIFIEVTVSLDRDENK